MLKKMLYRKIAVATSILLVILMLYLIPANRTDNININSKLEYIYDKNLLPVYLLDDYNHLTRTNINIEASDKIKKANNIIDSLTIGSKYKEIIPPGFKQLLPLGTKVLNIYLKDKTLTIDFSKEFNEISPEYEVKLLESLIYSLTGIEGIDQIEIYVEGNKLTKMPNSKEMLPKTLNRKFGINKEYEFTSFNDIASYTVYYVFNYNDETYYTPVTKYVNNSEKDKVKIIIDELSSSVFCEGNLISYLDNNVKLLNYEITDKTIKLNFNNAILTDITNDKIIEEVMYTIGLSLFDEVDVEAVTFMVNNERISTFYKKKLD